MPRPLLPLLLLFSVLASIAGGAVWFIQRDRQGLVEQFGRERQAQLEEATRGVSEALEDLGDDLRFAGELLAQPGTTEEHRRELRALLEAVGQYRAIAVYGPDGREQLALVDRRAQLMPREAAHATALADTAREALAAPQGRIVPSPPIEDASSRWMRVFATPLPADMPGGGGAVAILVDTEPFFAPLRLVTADENTRRLLLGVHGRASPLSDPALASWYQRLGQEEGHLVPGLRDLAARMRAGESGTLMLGEHQAHRLGMGKADVVATFMPIRMRSEASWSVATLSSTLALRSHERLLVLRLSLAALLVAVFLITFGAYVVLANRRAVALRESRRHADRLAHLHEKTQKILDHIPTGVLALNEEGRIGAVNQALRARLPPSALGGTLTGAFPAAPASVVRRLDELVAATREDGRVRSLHGEPLSLFGEKGQYNVHVVPLEHADEEVRTLLVRLHVDVPEHLPALAADADQLQQVILNLVLNACDACGAGGQVRMSASGVQGDTAGAHGMLELRVEDDGCGIAPEHLHQVFDPFFTTKKRGQGTGLGLTMVAQIVRNHGGQVELDSEPGQGTRVTLRWPIAAPRFEEQHAI